MHLASDYIHPYRSAGGRLAQCRVRIYLPEYVHDTPVVICSELPHYSGGPVTNSAEVIRSHELPTLLVWIEHWPKERRGGDIRAGRLLQLRGGGEGALPGRDEGQNRGRYLEETGPR